jgi:hypothetical protein
MVRSGGLHQIFLRVGLSRRTQEIRGATLIMHGDNGQIVPIGASAMLSSKIVKSAMLKVYPGASPLICLRSLRHGDRPTNSAWSCEDSDVR